MATLGHVISHHLVSVFFVCACVSRFAYILETKCPQKDLNHLNCDQYILINRRESYHIWEKKWEYYWSFQYKPLSFVPVHQCTQIMYIFKTNSLLHILLPSKGLYDKTERRFGVNHSSTAKQNSLSLFVDSIACFYWKCVATILCGYTGQIYQIIYWHGFSTQTGMF